MDLGLLHPLKRSFVIEALGPINLRSFNSCIFSSPVTVAPFGGEPVGVSLSEAKIYMQRRTGSPAFLFSPTEQAPEHPPDYSPQRTQPSGRQENQHHL